MNYIKEINAFNEWYKRKDLNISIENESDYKILLSALNIKNAWRSKFLYPKTIFIKVLGIGYHVLSGVMPVDSVYELFTKADMFPIADSSWEHNQVRKMICSKRIDKGIELDYYDYLSIWQAHCIKTFRWCIAWKPTPKIIVNELIPAERIKIPQKLREEIIAKYDSTCQYCNKKLKKGSIHIDHIIPVCQGGKTAIDNLTVSCNKCNLKKSGRTPSQAGMNLITKAGV